MKVTPSLITLTLCRRGRCDHQAQQGGGHPVPKMARRLC